MYLMNHEQVFREFGARAYGEIDIYTCAVEEELRRYEFGNRVTVTACVEHAAPSLPEYPKLFIHLRWSAPVQGEKELHVMHGVPIRELSAMVRKDIPRMNMALYDHVYMFAQRLLTTLVLTRLPKEMTGTGRTPTGPEPQNIPVPRREPPTPLVRGKRREPGW